TFRPSRRRRSATNATRTLVSGLPAIGLWMIETFSITMSVPKTQRPQGVPRGQFVIPGQRNALGNDALLMSFAGQQHHVPCLRAAKRMADSFRSGRNYVK